MTQFDLMGVMFHHHHKFTMLDSIWRSWVHPWLLPVLWRKTL